MEKKLSEITRTEWIAWNWMEAAPDEEDRVFIRGYRRTPDEAMQAAEEWDFLESVKNEEQTEERAAE